MTRPLNFIILLFFHVAAILADPVAQIEISQKNSQNPISHKPQPLDFPNERLYRAYLVIQRFKSSITSDPKNITATWTGHDICGEETYIGFYCGTPPGRGKELTVTAVILNGFDLHAPKLKGFVDQLPDVALFHAASNNLGSGLPRLGNLPYLYNLNTDNNLQTMEQAKPDGVSGKTQLTGNIRCISAFLNFRFNIGGSKGGDPGYTNSKAILLNYNQLSGPLPSDLGFSKLSFLALANNKLTGSIPSSIEHLKDTLQEVLLLNNQLSGCLPHELGMLIKAAVIDAGMNQLTGPIPASFSCLTSVEQLNLGGNRLYGEIPDAFCKLAAGPAGRLANLTLSSNYFTSVGPSCLSLIKDGVLNVKKNCIPGLANQRRPAECASFLSQPKTCPAASATHVACPAAPANAAATPTDRVAKDYSSYVTYATLHE